METVLSNCYNAREEILGVLTQKLHLNIILLGLKVLKYVIFLVRFLRITYSLHLVVLGSRVVG